MSGASNGRVRVVVTGIGAVTPLGLDVESSWDACRRGRSGVVPISLCEASDLSTRIAGEVKGFDAAEHLGPKEARRTSRCVALGLAAARQAVANSGFDVRSLGDEVGVLVASGIGGLEWLENAVVRLNQGGPRRVSPFTIPAMIPDMTAGRVAIEFGARGPQLRGGLRVRVVGQRHRRGGGVDPPRRRAGGDRRRHRGARSAGSASPPSTPCRRCRPATTSPRRRRGRSTRTATGS